MPDQSDLPAPLAHLIEKLLDAVGDITAELERGEISVGDWQREMERLLARYHEAAYMVGQDSPEIDDKAVPAIIADIEYQLGFLNSFAATIAGAAAWQVSWNARAAMYAQAIKVPYWQGATSGIPLPVMPGEGSECLGNCRCSWEIETLSEERGDYNAYWRMGAEKHCGTCPQRAAQWNPLKIRGGKVT